MLLGIGASWGIRRRKERWHHVQLQAHEAAKKTGRNLLRKQETLGTAEGSDGGKPKGHQQGRKFGEREREAAARPWRASKIKTRSLHLI